VARLHDQRRADGPGAGARLATTYTVAGDSEVAGSPPIGRPIRDRRAFVLDEALGLVPPGVAGELYLPEAWPGDTRTGRR
jgi:non-ribosomal peptide synthetase component F